jgi:NAD-dependent SIR2 family protein deacetylase
MNKNVQEAFEAVRKEDVVLWIGSGMSNYAGYPMGSQLSELIYNKLSSSEKRQVNKYDLASVAQSYKYSVNNGEQKLFALLKKEFQKAPESDQYHALLSKIYHIRTIITTNYDNLIESAYGSQCQTIITNTDSISIDTGKIQIFKIHGDLSDGSSIVLTKDDYENYFIDNESSIMSIILSEKIATKTHIFLGYSLEDININVWLKKIWSKIQGDKKTCFLVSPQISKSKIKQLRSKGIKYINFTAEDFIKDLYKSCYENLIADFNVNNIGADTLNKAFHANKLKPHIVGKENGFTFAGFQGTDGPFKAQIN